MTSIEELSAPGLIQERDYHRSELHGFEVDMSGRIIVPELNPNKRAGALSAALKFESQLLAAINPAA